MEPHGATTEPRQNRAEPRRGQSESYNRYSPSRAKSSKAPQHPTLEEFGNPELNELYKHYKDFFPDISIGDLVEECVGVGKAERGDLEKCWSEGACI